MSTFKISLVSIVCCVPPKDASVENFFTLTVKFKVLLMDHAGACIKHVHFERHFYLKLDRLVVNSLQFPESAKKTPLLSNVCG